MKFILKQLEKCRVLTRERMAMTKLAFNIWEAWVWKN